MFTYDDFLQKLEQYGVLSLTREDALPSLDTWISPGQWFTGNPQTDPWEFRIRVPRERVGLYGCHLGSKKVFISKVIAPVLLAACEPEEDLYVLYRAGAVEPVTYRLYELFSQKHLMTTSVLRQELGLREKKASLADRAVEQLQSMGYITIVDCVQKRSKVGEPYGWPVNLYQWTEDRLEALGLEASSMHRREARRYILDMFHKNSGDIVAQAAARLLQWNL